MRDPKSHVFDLILAWAPIADNWLQFTASTLIYPAHRALLQVHLPKGWLRYTVHVRPANAVLSRRPPSPPFFPVRVPFSRLQNQNLHPAVVLCWTIRDPHRAKIRVSKTNKKEKS